METLPPGLCPHLPGLPRLKHGFGVQGSAGGHSGTETHVLSCHVHLRTLPSILPFSVTAANVFECCVTGTPPVLTEQVWAGGAGGC